MSPPATSTARAARRATAPARRVHRRVSGPVARAAAAVREAGGNVTWLLDRAAAGDGRSAGGRWG